MTSVKKENAKNSKSFVLKCKSTSIRRVTCPFSHNDDSTFLVNVSLKTETIPYLRLTAPGLESLHG